MNDIKKKHLLIIWFIHVVLAILILILLQYQNFGESNRIKAFHASQLLISETEKIIAGNDADRENLQEFLKVNYLEKARTAARVVDLNPELQKDAAGLQALAKDMGVDQIHLLDENGFIYAGTDPEYYGLSLDSGTQIGFFKPMLKDKTLALSQDITPNTAENRIMLYAACWNPDGTRIVQVGAYGERFSRILNRNRIEMFLDMVPNDPSTDIILTDAGADAIIASSNPALKGKTLSQIGITLPEDLGETITEWNSGFDRSPKYCSAKSHKGYHILISQDRHQVNRNLPITLFTFAEYLILVFIAMTFVVNYYYDRFMEEKSYAMRDKLTGLYSRRAYETALAEMEDEEEPLSEDLVFVSMDVNGLKTINDTMGHQAGDLLLEGAAECMKQCFGPYGQVFRFGGDEFSALIYVKNVEIEPLRQYMEELCSQWSRENRLELSISVGFSLSCDNPDAGIHDLEVLADQQMYAEKSRYYAASGHNRRREIP